MDGFDLARGLPLLSHWSGSMLSNVGSVLFAFGVALLTGSISLYFPHLSLPGRILAWCGGPALFYLYIYQRIPMILGAHYGMNIEVGNAYLLMCIVFTVLIAWGARRFKFYNGA